MQDKMSKIIEEIQGKWVRGRVHDILSDYELDEGMINDLLDWAKREKHYELMCECIARQIENADDIGKVLVSIYLEILNNTVYKDNPKTLESILLERDAGDYGEEVQYYYTLKHMPIQSIKNLMRDTGNKPDTRLISQVLRNISSTTGVNPKSALMYCHDRVLKVQSNYRFASGEESSLELMDVTINPSRFLYIAALKYDLSTVKNLLDFGCIATKHEQEILTYDLKELLDYKSSDQSKIEALILGGADFQFIRVKPAVVNNALLKIECEKDDDKRNIDLIVECINAGGYFEDLMIPIEDSICIKHFRDRGVTIDKGGLGVNYATVYANITGDQPILHYAAIMREERLIQAILERCAEGFVNKPHQGRTALHYAVTHTYQSFATDLLLAKMSQDAIEIADEQGRTALHYAAMSYNLDAVKSLLARMSNDAIDKPDEDGKTALHYLALCYYNPGVGTDGVHRRQRRHNERSDVVKDLIKRVADFKSVDVDTKTLFKWAIENGHKNVVKALIERGADFKEVNVNGKTIFKWAIENGHKNVVKALTARGEKISRSDFENSEGEKFQFLVTMYIRQNSIPALAIISMAYITCTAISMMLGVNIPVISNLNSAVKEAGAALFKAVGKDVGS